MYRDAWGVAQESLKPKFKSGIQQSIPGVLRATGEVPLAGCMPAEAQTEIRKGGTK